MHSYAPSSWIHEPEDGDLPLPLDERTVNADFVRGFGWALLLSVPLWAGLIAAARALF